MNGVSGIFYLTLSMIGYGLNNGIQVQMARRAGEGDNEGLTKVLTNGILLSLGFSLAMMMLSLWLAPIIFGASLNDGENALLSVRYLYVRVWGAAIPDADTTDQCVLHRHTAVQVSNVWCTGERSL